jgi:hypothetical protein
MRTATNKKVINQPIKLATKKRVAKKAIATTNRTKITTALVSQELVIPEPSKTKQSQLIALLKSPNGATVQDLMKATGWQAHSIRGVISGVIKKRLGLTVISEKLDGNHHYRIEGA